MRNASGECADAFHPLGALELLLQSLLIRDVGVDRQNTLRSSAGVTHERPASFNDDFPALSSDLVQLAGPLSNGNHTLTGEMQGGCVFVLQFSNRTLNGFFSRPAIKALRAFIPVGDVLIEVANEDGISGLIE